MKIGGNIENSFVTEKLLSNKMAVDGKSRKRLSVIVLYHVSVFACGHIYITRARHIKRIPRKRICEHRIVSYVIVSYVT